MKNKRDIVALIVMVSLCLIACAGMQADLGKAEGHLTVGAAFIKTGEYTNALRELYAAEKIAPNDPRAHCYLGIAYLGKDARDRAFEEFQKAVDLNPDYSEAHNYLGTMYLENKQWDLAIASFDRALSNILYDTPAVSLYNKGWALYKKGEFRKSVDCNRKAMQLRDAQQFMPVLQKNTGLSLLALGEYAEASNRFVEAVKLAPDYPEAKYWLAITKVQQKNYTEASRLFQELIQKNPQSEFSARGKDMLEKMKKGKYEEVRWYP